jgi:putative effector of murein hydrolase
MAILNAAPPFGIGTARAFQESEEAGAFSGLAMGLSGLVTAVIFPLGVWLVRALS